MLTKDEKTSIITSHQADEKDTGSASVQIALLTEQIKKLTIHMKENKHDYSSKRGMDKMISRRAKLLSYLKETNSEEYDKAIAEIKGAKKSK